MNNRVIKTTKHWSHHSGSKQRSWYKNRIYFCLETGKPRPPFTPGNMIAPFYNSGGGAPFISYEGMDKFLEQYNPRDILDSVHQFVNDVPGCRYVFDQLVFAHGIEFSTEDLLSYFLLKFS
jgi:hypothetical protein